MNVFQCHQQNLNGQFGVKIGSADDLAIVFDQHFMTFAGLQAVKQRLPKPELERISEDWNWHGCLWQFGAKNDSPGLLIQMLITALSTHCVVPIQLILCHPKLQETLSGMLRSIAVKYQDVCVGWHDGLKLHVRQLPKQIDGVRC